MKKRLIIISILVICILCTAFAISACIVKSKDLFVVEGDVIVDTTYSGRKETYINIPEGIVGIGDEAFYNCYELTSIFIPSSVTEIASNSFNDCSSLVIRFKAKDIPDEWRSKFTYGTFLERYDIPIVLDCDNNDVAINGYVYTVAENGVQYALKDAQAKVTGHSAISGDVEIADSIVYDGRSYKVTEIDRYSFYKASDVNSVEILDGVKTIGNYAFYYCGLIELDLPIGIEQIGDSAFSYCYSLKSVQLPSGLTRIGKDVFSNCLALGSITVKIGDRVNFVSSGNCLIEKATNKLIAGCKDSVIPDNVKIIGEYAFANCNHLYNIEIPDGVIEIEEAAFYSSGLEKIVLPSSVISIGKRAFEYCRSLQRADIPSSVTSIGKDAFAYCKRDMNIYCEAKSQPSGWDSQWCAGNCKVKWGVDR